MWNFTNHTKRYSTEMTPMSYSIGVISVAVGTFKISMSTLNTIVKQYKKGDFYYKGIYVKNRNCKSYDYEVEIIEMFQQFNRRSYIPIAINNFLFSIAYN